MSDIVILDQEQWVGEAAITGSDRPCSVVGSSMGCSVIIFSIVVLHGLQGNNSLTSAMQSFHPFLNVLPSTSSAAELSFEQQQQQFFSWAGSVPHRQPLVPAHRHLLSQSPSAAANACTWTMLALHQLTAGPEIPITNSTPEGSRSPFCQE